MTDPSPVQLLEATRQLADRVDALSRHIHVSQKQLRRTRLLSIFVAVLSLLCLAGVASTYNLYTKVSKTQEQGQQNAITACKNANETRVANQALWDFIISASASQNPNQTPEGTKLLKELKVFVAELYKEHDCSDLSKTYPIPKPPVIP
jgi:cell division protein ZapA (FtsZ GTPase activity inhibitor)